MNIPFAQWEVLEREPAIRYDSDAEHFYVLDENRQPVRALEQEWMAATSVEVASTDLGDGWAAITSFDGSVQAEEDQDGGPFLFRTLVIMAHSDDDYVASYRTWEEAEAGHRQVVERYKERLGVV